MRFLKPICIFLASNILECGVGTSEVLYARRFGFSARSGFSSFLNAFNALKRLAYNPIGLPRRDIRFYTTFDQKSTIPEMAFSAVANGTAGTPDYELKFFDKDGKAISPWHEIPLSAGPGLFHMVVEIPRHTTAKMEIFTKLPKTPIKQDVLKGGELRHLECAMYWNYGAIPQTWELPKSFVHEYSNGQKLELVGDNDPLDIVDVGDVTLEAGAVVAVKVVGALTLVDQGEIDFKLFGVRSNDKHFDKINDLADVDLYYPGTTSGITEFFRWYKTPRGKPLNQFLPEKQFLNRKEALEVIEKTHKDYLELLQGKHDPDGLSLV